jgi:ubiquinone/menaquinone biosynthesis C-methylase UbiE
VPDNPFFKNFAEEYSKSKSHRYGDDLTILSNLMGEDNEVCLDIAAGTGFTTIELSKRCKRVIALDQTASMIEKARELANSKGIRNIDFINLDFELFRPEFKFDVITIRRALHHFRDKDLFFSKSSESLKAGGSILIADMLSPEGDYGDLFNSLERLRDSTHVGALREEDYKYYFKKYGLTEAGRHITTEKFSFSEWLYPIDEKSKIALDCLNFLRSLNSDALDAIGFDLPNMTLLKKRIIIQGKKTRN